MRNEKNELEENNNTKGKNKPKVITEIIMEEVLVDETGYLISIQEITFR